MQLLRFSRLVRSQRSAGSLPWTVDIVVYIFILLLGVLQFNSYPRAADFMNDVMYSDLARSILEKGSYQFNFLPETTLPPGFPLILAVVGWFAGLSPAVLFHVIAVCTTLGLITAYQLLRRVEGRVVAAAACLLLGSSPALFSFTTQLIFSDMPYLLLSMLALLLALQIESPSPWRTRIGWMLPFTIALVLAVLVRSAGITLLLGLMTWIFASILVDQRLGRRRIKWFIIPLALGLITQLVWTMWAQHRQTAEWQLGGWPKSYVQQLKVKNGNQPELGMARLSDIPSRVCENVVSRVAEFGTFLTRRRVSRFWSSPAIFGVLALIVIGLVTSFRNGGQLYDWYFLWHEAIYLLWPWNFELRFLIPTVPLACLYLWRGAKAFRSYAIGRPQRVGLCLVVSGAFLMLSSAAFALRILIFPVSINHLNMDRVQPVAAALFWGIVMVIGIGMLRLRFAGNSPIGAKAFLNWIGNSEIPLSGQFAAVLVLATLVGQGVAQEVHLGRDNARFDVTKGTFYPEIEAAAWTRTHEPRDRVIMARKQDLVFHNSRHHVVWFPPISAPNVIMEGIRRNHVSLVIVAHHGDSYWLPPEDVCLHALLQKYGPAFHLVHRGPDNWVYEVEPEDYTAGL